MTSASGIYCIRNTVTGKVYVGSAVNMARRWRSHRRELSNGLHCNPRLRKDAGRYGIHVFAFSVLELVPDRALLTQREQHWIDMLRSADRATGYNICPIAGSGMGVLISAETRAKLSSAHKGRKLTAEHRAKIAAARTGKRHTAEVRARLSAAKKGNKLSAEHRAKISSFLRTRKHKPSTIDKMSAWKRPPELCAAISSALSGKPKSPEHRAKLASALLGRKVGPQSPETIAKRVAATRATKLAKATAREINP
jgi:group I intron endonuclease